MPDPITLDKANPFNNKAEDYDFLRLEGIKHIEKLSGEIWTDYNTHDPGITLLEALCYAITDLAYRTGSEIKDLIAPGQLDKDSWKNIFYTARQIFPCNVVTINDYRKLLIDIIGVRNAWITKSEDCEVPIYISYPENFDDEKNKFGEENLNPCGDENKIPVKLAFAPDDNATTSDKIIELNGLYKVIIEYEEDIIESQHKKDIRKQILKQLHCHRNLCEDFLTVTDAEYRDFSLQTEILIKDNADPEKVLAEICFRIQNYFTPNQKFYTLEELLKKGNYVDDIFDGPFLEHGFILDEELEKTDLFRDMRLSDIINEIADIDGIVALREFKVNDNLFPDDPDDATDTGPFDEDDPCSNEKFFDEWIAGMKKDKLVGRLNINEIIEHINDKDKEAQGSGPEIKAPIRVFKSNNRVTINTARFKKLLGDLKALDRNAKLIGHNKDLPVPVGENLELQNFYPVQYTLPKTYKVGEDGLPMHEGNKRLAQALQLKGYLAIFEQLFLNYLAQLNNINNLFSFNEISETSFIKKIIDRDSAGDELKYKEEITGYLHLYADTKKYVDTLQELTEDEGSFYRRRNNLLDHLLARFSEEMNEYSSLMKYLYPKDYAKRIIKNKTDFLADYVAISKNRGKAYNYKLEEECWDDTETGSDEEKISRNVSGLERRISRLLGCEDFKRKYIAPENLLFEKSTDGKGIIRLYDDYDKKIWLLESEDIREDCEDHITHCFIESGCCERNFIKTPEQNHQNTRRKKHYNDKYGFVLRDDKDPRKKVIAESPNYATPEIRDEALKKAIQALKTICHEEALHMVEHILLRPKGDDAEDAYTIKRDKPPVKTQGTSYELLDICLDKCDLNVGVNNPTLPVLYKFEISVLTIEECVDSKRWRVELKQVGKAAAILSRDFLDYEQASEFISVVRTYGSEFANFKIFKTASSPVKYFFRLYNEDGRMLFESNTCYSKISPNLFFEKKSLKEEEKRKCEAPDTDDIWKEIKAVKEFLAYELDLYCCEDICDHDEDPYSFRVSFVLPCWPKRFRDKSFRAFVERTIRSETPAHIHPKIYWLGIEQMRKFENAWSEWLVEMACNDIPEIQIVNNFIKVVKELKNCDQPCKDDTHA
ncbi:MAG TPA: hypothetical protein VNT20_18105 [Flavisolibacter sp.]|nr:hypothetical protein [Flavisolibacter sp.]